MYNYELSVSPQVSFRRMLSIVVLNKNSVLYPYILTCTSISTNIYFCWIRASLYRPVSSFHTCYNLQFPFWKDQRWSFTIGNKGLVLLASFVVSCYKTVINCNSYFNRILERQNASGIHIVNKIVYCTFNRKLNFSINIPI